MPRPGRTLLADHGRPRRRLGDYLRKVLHCPLCTSGLRVVAYRSTTVRLECSGCELRFSVDPYKVGEAMITWPEAMRRNREFLDSVVEFLAATSPSVLAIAEEDTDRFVAALEDEIKEIGAFICGASMLRPQLDADERQMKFFLAGKFAADHAEARRGDADATDERPNRNR